MFLENNSDLFETIAAELLDQGLCVLKNGVPEKIAKALQVQASAIQLEGYKQAGVGRGQEQIADRQIRSDEIHWIDGGSKGECEWLEWMSELQQYLNRRLFLGLFSFESHFAHYSSGDFYEKHYDAFKGQVNRMLTVVTYLNSNWKAEYGGELLVYGDVNKGQEKKVIHTVSPELGTIVIFLSELFPHEVLPAKKDRYSIAGWFRVNGSSKENIDPPH